MKESIMFILVTIVLALLTMALLDVGSRIDELESNHAESIETQTVNPDSIQRVYYNKVEQNTVGDKSPAIITDKENVIINYD